MCCTSLTKSLFIFFVFSTAIVWATEFHGVCVGINDYPGTMNDLQWCVADANEMRYALINEQGWSSSAIALLLNGTASETNIMNAIQAMPRSTGYTDLFHFSGHGDSQELGGSDGLIPANSLSARITQSELESWFGGSYDQYSSFLDACGSGIFPRDLSNGVISSACEADEYADESSGLENGVFSFYLIEGLTDDAADPSGIVSAEELHAYAAPRTTNYNSSQHPQLGDNYSGSLNLREPLSVSISGPSVAPCATGTWTANVSGGTPPYSFAWYHKWVCDDGMDKPCDEYTSVGTNSATLQMYLCGGNSMLRVDVTDSRSTMVSDEHYVAGADGGDPKTNWTNDSRMAKEFPVSYSLEQNRPNPFNPQTLIQYQLPEASKITLTIYNLFGQELRTLVAGQREAGCYSEIWDGRDDFGRRVASGVYFYRLSAEPNVTQPNGFQLTRKMVLTQ